MKKLLVFLFAALAAGVVLSVRATEAQWTFDGSTLTDGNWIFGATVNGTELTVNAVQSDPGEGATLDFSKPIADGYVIVKLNPNFGAYENKANLATLVLPTEGLTTISADAFKSCTSLTSITPFLPDCVTTLGNGAFAYVSVEAPVMLMGVTSVPNGTFLSSKITAVTFGPNLQSISGSYTGGSFSYCSNLAKLNFDPNMSGAKFTGQDIFANCSKLGGLLDLTGFSSFTERIFYFYGGSYSKVVFSDIIKASEGTLDYLNTAKTIEFTGGVPTDKNFYKMYNRSGSGRVNLQNVFTVVKEEFKDEWAQYCEGGVINEYDSIWDLSKVPEAATRGLYLVYEKQGGGGGEVGDWVYSDGAVTSASQGWSFSATRNSSTITMGECLAHPEESGSLDLSTRMTDEDGNELMLKRIEGLFVSNKAASPHAPYLTELVLPSAVTAYGSQCFFGCANLAGEVVVPEGVTEIGSSFFEKCAKLESVRLPSTLQKIGSSVFLDCSSLRTITPLLPDSVTSVGGRAFYRAAIGGDVRLAGIVNFADEAFRCSSLRSVYFGPGLKTVGSAAFTVCSITNVSFDAGISDAKVTGASAFANGSLKGTLDLSGFTSLGSANNLCGESAVSSIIFGEDLEDIHAGAILAMKSLTNLTFKGAPPTGVEGLFTNIQNDGDKIPNGWGVAAYTNAKKTVVYQYDKYTVDTWVPHKYRKQWAAFAKDGVLNNKTSYWAADYVNTTVDAPAKRKLMMYDWTPGLMLIIK